ncbi:MAG TPA: hypothetical protein VFT16_01895, partial [Candidatus Saccharimonadales bacterium]|nr:hypothetical protein [Candidatus Saccharimonadales bacterium]
VSQAAGIEILDAYTVRKVLPRLLFAAIFIALSWDILEFLTSLSNDAGNGIRGLIYAPFKDMAELGGTISGGSLFALTLIGTGAALAFGWLGLLSFVITGFLASMVALAVLIVRKMIIVLIIIMSPFAIAASVLPNTRKLYELWKGTLVALLVVFPIIMAFIAIGRVFAVVSFHAPGNQTVNQLIAIVAYFAPYFLITTAFKLAGGVIATLGGLANDRTKGLFDRVSGYRANKVSQNMAKMGQGQRFQGSNPLARGFNAATFGATAFAKAPNKASMLRPGRRGRLARQNALGQRRNLNAMAYAKSDAAAVAARNDAILRAQTYANAAEALARMQYDFGMDEASVKNAVAQAKANGGFGQNQQIYAVRSLFASDAGFDDLRQAAESIHRVAGNNDEIAMSLIGEGNAISMVPPDSKGATGRADLGITFMGHVKLQQALRERGHLTDTEIDEGYVEAAKNNESYNIAKGNPRASQNIMPALTRALENANRVANDPNAGLNEAGQSRQALAKEEAGRLSGIIEQLQSNATYTGSAVVRGNIAAGMRDTKDLRDAVKIGSSTVELHRDTRTGELIPTQQADPANPGRSVPQYKEPDEDVARGYDEQRPRR